MPTQDPINLFDPATYVCLFQTGPRFPTSFVVFLCSIVLGGRSLCCYWCNCWPSLFKLSFRYLVSWHI